MKKLFLLSLTALLLGLSLSNFVLAQNDSVEIVLFYSETCPHCHEERLFLDQLKEKYPQLQIKEYEVINNKDNQQLLVDFYQKYEVPKSEWGRVPVSFTPDKYFIGFSQQIGDDMETCLEECLLGQNATSTYKIKLPVLGVVDLSQMSLPAITVTLAALDGFNPCAMWILIFLITLLVNVRSKKRMYLIGGTFILASGLVYYLILTAWLKLFLAISYVNQTRILIGAFSLIVGVYQIKEFINYKPGVCKVTDGQGLQEKIKNNLKGRAEKLVISPLNLGIIVGVIILALGVNLVEFFCSAGLPAIYTRILALNNISSINHHLYLLLYTFIFMLDDLIIFLIAAFALSKIGVTEKYNYWTTLIGGLLIFILGLLLIFKPEILMFS